MAKSKLIDEKVAKALSKKDLYAVPKAEEAHLYKSSFEEKKEVVSTPGHTTRAFRS